MQGRAVVVIRAHNLGVAGSSPCPAITAIVPTCAWIDECKARLRLKVAVSGIGACPRAIAIVTVKY